MRVRRFTADGLDAFRTLLDDAKSGIEVDPHLLLESEALTENVSPEVEVGVRGFGNRREAGEHLWNLLEPLRDADGEHVEADVGLWTWLACFWFDELSDRRGRSRPKIGELARWLLHADDYKKYYRHLLAGPYRIYGAHSDDPDRAMAVLSNSVHTPGEVSEQISAYQGIVSSPNLMEAATRLYFNAAEGSLQRGAAGKGGGSSRRLADVLDQLELTWDILGMKPQELLDRLPREFDRFVNSE